jgi:sorbitol/mannitol transport system substrate-binding protein
MDIRRASIGIAVAATIVGFTPAVAQTQLTIATVNNGDMVRMQKLSGAFTQQHPDIKLNWVTLEENVLRQRVTTDIATHGGQFDVITIGTYEVPIWAKRHWLVPLQNLGAGYDVDDLLPKVRANLSFQHKLYGAPFYAESAFTMYRKDLFEKAGLTMPQKPTWNFIVKAAEKITDRSKAIYGICLRGKAGWGENMAFIGAMANSFGGRWFDQKWHPQFDQPEWKATLSTYVDLMRKAGPPGASSNGFNENLALFNSGRCGIWIDATVAGSFVTDPKQSAVAGKVGFAQAPNTGLGKNANWLWAWALAVPAGSKKVKAAESFIGWATSKGYTRMVASKDGWANVPPGTRISLYKNAQYLAAAPFAKMTIAAINSANPLKPTVKPVPYIGISFPSIPEYQGIGTRVGQIFSAALSGSVTVDDALARAQQITTRVMTRAGYIK